MNCPDISTHRLLLKVASVADAPWITDGISNPQVHCWLTSPPYPFVLGDAESFLAQHENDPLYRTIWLGANPIGVVSLHKQDDGTLDLGYWLSETHWGHGYMSEAAHGLLAWHFNHGGGPVSSGWIVGNAASENVLRKLGFEGDEPKQEMSRYYARLVDLVKVRLDKMPKDPKAGREPGKAFQGGLFVSGERLNLRPLVSADLPSIIEFAGAPENARMTSSIPSPFSLDEADTWLDLRGIHNPPGFSLAVTLKNGQVIGMVGCGPGPKWEVGYGISPDFRGQGYASEAVAMMIAEMRSWQDAPEVFNACVFTDNPSSARVLERNGFKYIGDCTSDSRARVEPAPVWQYRLMCNDAEGNAQ